MSDKDEAAESKADPLHEHREAFARYMDAWHDDRERYVDDLRFASGDQWHEKDRKARKDEGRPCLTVDKLSQYIKQVVNDSRQNRPGIKVRPVDSGADVETAEIYQGIIRHIEDRSNSDTAYDTALECAVKGGFGFFRILREYVGDKSFNQDLRIKRIRNPLTVLFDPDCQEPDGSDSKRVYIWEDMPEADYKANYPKAEAVDWESDSTKLPDWFNGKKVRVAECYWIETESKDMYLLADGSVVDGADLKKATEAGLDIPETIDTRTIDAPILKWAKFNGKEYLEGPQDEPGKWVPVIPVWGNETDIEGEVIHTGMIHPAKDAQRLYNYSRTASAERLSKPGTYVAADGQVADYEADWDGSNRNVAVKRYTPVDVGGAALPPPRFDATDIPSALVQDMQISEHDIQGALGMYNASLGEKSNEKSGKAIIARQREGDVANFHYHDNLARAMRHAGRILVNLIPKVYDTARVVRVLGIDGTAEMAEINPDLPQASVKQGSKAIYNLNVGEYDVSVSVGPSYTTQRQEASEMMGQMFQGNPALLQVMGDLFFRNQDWPGADEIADRMKLMLPPQIQQAEKDEQGLPPQVQQAMQQAQQAIQQRDQALQQVMQQAQQMKAELDALKQDQAATREELSIKARETEIKAYDAETKRAQVLAPAFDPQQIQQLVMQTMQDLLSQQSPQMPMDRRMENMPQSMIDQGNAYPG